MYMYAHPGKKLNFMGNELAHFREWDEKRELDWGLLASPLHDGFHAFMKDVYKRQVLSPVGKIVDHGKEICFPSGMDEMGPVVKKLYDTLTGIQMGRIEGPEGWVRRIL